jgi:nucleoside transporter
MINKTKAQLGFMMFLQFFIWGSWYATAGNYMRESDLAELIYIAYMASPIGSIVAPFILGMIADRFYPVQKVMAILHLLGGVFIIAAPLSLEHFSSSPVFITCLFLHMLCYMPTVGLATATAFHLLKARNREFPPIRMLGTVGWIAAGILVSYVLNADHTPIPMYVSGVASMAMGVFCFLLPDIPPPASGGSLNFREIIGTRSTNLFNRQVVIFLVSILLTSIPLATYYAYAPLYLKAAEIPNPAFRMTFGQMSEIVFLLLMPWFLLRYGVKRVILFGMIAWVFRYILFAVGAPEGITWMIILGILLHGICYDFVYVAGQMYLDQVASVKVRARVQGLFVLVSYGIGQGLGTLIAGWIYSHTVLKAIANPLEQWQVFWIIPAVLGSIITIGFLLGIWKNKV